MVEDIFMWLAGGKVFTKLYLSQAYLQLPVNEDSIELQQIFDLLGICSLRVYPDTKFTIQIFIYW